MKSRVRTPDTVSAVADERIPFPRTARPTPCQDDPALVAFEEAADRLQRTKTIARAKVACSGCPVVQGCLKWALANPSLTRRGVWAATTPGKRGALRNGLVRRLGDDWVGVVADQDRRHEQQQTARTVPPTIRGQLPPWRPCHRGRRASAPTASPGFPPDGGQDSSVIRAGTGGSGWAGAGAAAVVVRGWLCVTTAAAAATPTVSSTKPAPSPGGSPSW